MATSPSPEPPSAAASAFAWSSWPQAAGLILAGATLRPALPVAIVVGTLLCLLNQGADLLTGDIGVGTLPE